MNDWKSEYTQKIGCLNIDDVDATGAEALRIANLPTKLYKYRDVNKYSLDNLANDTVWFDKASTFNDPFEFAEHVDSDIVMTQMIEDNIETMKNVFFEGRCPDDIKEQIQNSSSPNKAFLEYLYTADEHKGIKEMWEELLQNLKNSFNERQNLKVDAFQELLSICCFCESAGEQLMWSHYANSYTGFCIEYNIEKWSINDDRKKILYPVIYQSEMYDATAHLKNAFEMKPLNPFYAIISGCTKSVQWEYEKEWRFIRYGRPNNYQMNCQSKVFLGFKMTDENTNKVLDICKSNKLEAYWAEPSKNSYQIVFTKIEL